MSQRVLGSEEAKSSIKKMQSIINGPLLDQITSLNNEGQRLSDPNVWDGNLAVQFRNDWPTVHTNLVTTKDKLDQLRSQLDQILLAIMNAGGN